METTRASSSGRSILLVSNTFSAARGNYGSVARDLADRLAQGKWTVFKASEQPNRWMRLADMVWTTWAKRQAYSVAQVDVFSEPSFMWAEVVCWVLRRLRKPYVLTLHGGNLPAFAQRHPQRVRRLLGSAGKVTAPSRYLRERMGDYRPDIVLLPNPLELSNYTFSKRVNPQPQVVWLRAFNSGYNPGLAARVVALLRSDFPDVRLLMIGRDKGDGSFQTFQQTVESLGIGSHVDCPGGVAKTDVSSWLNKGDIFLNTTNIDNTPVSVMEAMACGLCVVSTNVGGIPYLLDHERDALLVPPNDPEAMAAAVRRILIEPGLAEHLSRNARKKAEQFDWGTILPQWEELLMTVARSSANRA